MVNEIIAVLKSNATILGLVSVDNITPSRQIQGNSVPAIVVDVIGARGTATKDCVSTHDFYDLEINIFHKSHHQCVQVYEACRAALDQYSNILNSKLFEIRYDSYATGYVTQSEDIFVVSMQVSGDIQLNVSGMGAGYGGGGDSGGGDSGEAALSWIDYAVGFASTPQLIVQDGSGNQIYKYPMGGLNEVYRFIPNPYESYEDAFYENFSSNTVSELIVRRSGVPA